MEKTLSHYVVLDVECTGLRADSRIIELAAVKVIDGQIVAQFQQLVNPETTISAYITALTGISNAMVADAPTIKTVLSQFNVFWERLPIVGHNVGFDCTMLRREAERIGIELDLTAAEDTRFMARYRFPRWDNFRLSTVCANLGIKINGAHRALADVLATQQVFEALKEIPESPERYSDFHSKSVHVGPTANDLYEMARAKNVNFHDMSFVITGECPLLSREEATDLIQKLNGVVRGKVSAKTGCLIYEPGFVSTKSLKAKELIDAGAPIAMMSMQEFLQTLGYMDESEA